MTPKWQPGVFPVWSRTGWAMAAGYLYRGLGLRERASDFISRHSRWELVHIGSGRLIATLRTRETVARSVAAQIAECGRWDFLGVHGYIDIDPTLPEKFHAIAARYPVLIQLPEGAAVAA